MKLSNSCTRRDGRRPGVLLQLADSPAASDRGGVSPLSSPFDLNQLTHLLLTTAHPLLRPALCGRGGQPLVTLSRPGPCTVQTPTRAKKADRRKDAGGGRGAGEAGEGYGKSKPLLDALLPSLG